MAKGDVDRLREMREAAATSRPTEGRRGTQAKPDLRAEAEDLKAAVRPAMDRLAGAMREEVWAPQENIAQEGVGIHLRLTPQLLMRIDAARVKFTGVPTRQQWIRRVIEEALK